MCTMSYITFYIFLSQKYEIYDIYLSFFVPIVTKLCTLHSTIFISLSFIFRTFVYFVRLNRRVICSFLLLMLLLFQNNVRQLCLGILCVLIRAIVYTSTIATHLCFDNRNFGRRNVSPRL